jgi:hypothetical protein
MDIGNNGPFRVFCAFPARYQFVPDFIQGRLSSLKMTEF